MLLFTTIRVNPDLRYLSHNYPIHPPCWKSVWSDDKCHWLVHLRILQHNHITKNYQLAVLLYGVCWTQSEVTKKIKKVPFGTFRLG